MRACNRFFLIMNLIFRLMLIDFQSSCSNFVIDCFIIGKIKPDEMKVVKVPVENVNNQQNIFCYYCRFVVITKKQTITNLMQPAADVDHSFKILCFCQMNSVQKHVL